MVGKRAKRLRRIGTTYGTTTGQVLSTLKSCYARTACRLGVSCVTGTRLFFPNFGVTETADAARSSPSIFLVFHCHD